MYNQNGNKELMRITMVNEKFNQLDRWWDSVYLYELFYPSHGPVNPTNNVKSVGA